MIIKNNQFTNKILIITSLCIYSVFSFAQETAITEVALPSEIKSINALLSSEEIVWMATGQGMYSYNGQEFTRYYNPQQAEIYCINAMIADKAGNKWWGTYNGMLVKFGKSGILKTLDIKSFCKTDNYLITSISINLETNIENQDILLTTSGGEIFVYNAITGAVKNVESPSDATIYSIKYGYSSTIWLCTSDGFYTRNSSSKWKKKSDIYTAYGLFENDGKYWAIGRDKDKKAVLMLYYNEDSEEKNGKFIWKDFDLHQLKNVYTRLYEVDFTSDEIVWIAAESGLIRYNPLNASIQEYIKDNIKETFTIQHIAVQDDKLLWMSTPGKKLFRVDLK